MTIPVGNSEPILHKLYRVDAREVWKHEAHEFTPWLLDHIGELNQAIGFEIELSGKEEPVGTFAVDLFGRDVQTGQPAIIENQLEDSDHRHLGQLVTYASGLKAGLIVWVAPRFRPEHQEALKWLNEISAESVSFFGIELEILEINGHRAPNFKLVAEPNAWQKSSAKLSQGIGPGSGAVTQRMAAYQSFFQDLLNDLKTRAPGITNAGKTQAQSWFQFAAGRAGAYFAWAFTQDSRFKAELTFDTLDDAFNRLMVHWLWSLRDSFTLESDVRSGLELDVSETRRSQRLACYAPWSVSIESTPDDLARTRAWAVPAMIQLATALRPLVRETPSPTEPEDGQAQFE